MRRSAATTLSKAELNALIVTASKRVQDAVDAIEIDAEALNPAWNPLWEHAMPLAIAALGLTDVSSSRFTPGYVDRLASGVRTRGALVFSVSEELDE